MSGDVQPRKRKDKRRKKESGSLGMVQDHTSLHKFKNDFNEKKTSDLDEQPEKIHLQNEHGVGGNFFVKIIFFCLLGLLIGAVSLIYLQSQGSTDVDLPSVDESRFAEYFTGWLDDSTDDHEPEIANDHKPEIANDHESPIADEDGQEKDDHEDDNIDQVSEMFTSKLYQIPDPISGLFGFGVQEVNQVIDDNNVYENSLKSDEERESNEVTNADDEKEDTEEEEDEQNDENRNVHEDENDENDDEDNIQDNEDNSEEAEDTVSENDLEKLSDEEENKTVFSRVVYKHKEYASSLNHDNFPNDDDDDDDDDNDEDDDDEETESEDAHQEVNEYFIENKRFAKIDHALKADNDDNNEDNDEVTESVRNKGNSEYDVEGSYVNRKERTIKMFFDNDDDDDLGHEEIDESEETDYNEYKSEKERRIVAKIEKAKKEIGYKVESSKKLILDVAEPEKETDNDETDSENSDGGVAIKIGVGIALIIVAHLVLVQKWKARADAHSDEPVSNETNTGKLQVDNLNSNFEPVTSRRQTLIDENIELNDKFDDEKYEYEEDEYEYGEEREGEEEGSEEEDDYSEEQDSELEGKVYSIKLGEKFSENARDLNANLLSKKNLTKLAEKKEEEEDENYEEEYSVGEEEEEEEEEEELSDKIENESEEYEDDEEIFAKEADELLEPYEEEQEENNNLKTVEEIPPTPLPRTRRRGAQDNEYFLNENEEFIRHQMSDNDSKEDRTEDVGDDGKRSSESKVGNEDEWVFREELNFADEHFENNPKAALKTYDDILSKNWTHLKALVGRARVLDHLAELERSNVYLKQAIMAYKSLLEQHGHRIDDETFLNLAERCVARMRFGGYLKQAIEVHKGLIKRFPNTPKYRNTLAVTYLMLNKIDAARTLLKETLTRWPDNGFALAHYGFILKTTDNNMEEGAKLLMEGIRTKEEGVIDGIFFFHLGDALNRLGRPKEAMKWYDLGVKEGLFLSRYQRSLYNINRLKGQPWWTKEETTYETFFQLLENNWKEIRREGLELLNSKGVNLFKEEAENLKDTGDWRQLDLFFRGKKQQNCQKAPVTCSLVSSFKPAASCTRGQIKFSVMLPDTHVWPHCGPTNCRLRSHLGLVVPKKTYIRVAEETRTWEEGKFIVFDDSFEHEVWHNGTGPRLVLIVDVWHPEVTQQERVSLSPI